MSKTIVVGFSRSSKFSILSQLVRLYTGTEYAHCYVKFTHAKLVSHAHDGMVHFIHESSFLLENTVIQEFTLNVTDLQFQQIVSYTVQTAGKKYSMLQNVGIVLADLFKLKENPFGGEEDFICSEYLGQILRLLGCGLDKHVSLLTPKDIFLHVEKKHG